MNEIDQLFTALADPTRRQIVERLSAGQASMSELSEPFDMSLSAVHQHIAVLEGVGLVRTQKIGRVRMCEIGEDKMKLIERWLEDRRKGWERKLDSLEKYLNKGGDK